MKKALILFVALFAPALVQAEVIHSFVSDVIVSEDGSFAVTETIIYDFENVDRHGIFRFIPTNHPQGSVLFHDRLVEIDVDSVTLDGQGVPFKINQDLSNWEVKIGDPNSTITGEHTYVIKYSVRGGLSYYDSNTAELYWNITGNDWQVPIENVSARIFDPDGVTLDQAHCYFGVYGANTECVATSGPGGTVFGQVALNPGEGLTIAQELDATKIDKLILERLSLWPLWLIGAFLWLIGLAWFLYRHFFEYKTHASTIAQYEPYEGFKPMYTGLLFDGRIDAKDITAGIVYLAEQGFFKIKRIEQKKLFFINTEDYELTLQRPYTEIETAFQKSIFTLLFDTNAAVGEQVVLSKLAKNVAQQKENYKTLTSLRAAAEEDLIKQGFFEKRWRKLLKIELGLLIALILLLTGNALGGADMGGPIVISIGVFTISFVLLVLVHRRRTRKGYLALDYLKGFKLFLSVTDKERFKFHNSPTKSPEQFMVYLPYAIAFGVEKEWAEIFKDINIPEPDWYEGHGAAFNAVYLSQSLGSFGSAVTSASGSNPASSGGGMSGGGAGGGGGGSW